MWSPLKTIATSWTEQDVMEAIGHDMTWALDGEGWQDRPQEVSSKGDLPVIQENEKRSSQTSSTQAQSSCL